MTTNSNNKNKLIILGSGAAPGVPSLSWGWGDCDPNQPKNRRMRVGTYIEYKGVKFLIDTGPDLRQQLLNFQIRGIDAVLYTHRHADHLHGIDDLREINRITEENINIYGNEDVMKAIKQRFGYLISNGRQAKDALSAPSLRPHIIKNNHPFYIKGIKITPLKLLGHPIPCTGYAFDDGEFVHIADCKALSSSAQKHILKRPKAMIMPLTVKAFHKHHMDISKIMEYFDKIKPNKLVINHMSTECDYDTINNNTPDDFVIGFDNMELEF